MTLKELISKWDIGGDPFELTIFGCSEDNPDDWCPVYTQSYVRHIRDIPGIYLDKQIVKFNIFGFDELQVYLYS